MKYKNNDVHEMLREAMKSPETPDTDVVGKIRSRANQEEFFSNDLTRIHQSKGPFRASRYLKVAVVALALLLISGVTVYAATQLLNPGEVAGELGDPGLRAAFESEDAIMLNQTLTAGGYRFTLLAMVSGYDLANYEERFLHVYFEGEILGGNQTYVVVAVEREDGLSMHTPVGSTYKYVIECLENYPPIYSYVEVETSQSFLFYTLIGGVDLGFVRYVPEHGWLTFEDSRQPHPMFIGFTSIYIEGVVYHFIEIEHMKPFASHGIYLGVAQSTEDRSIFHGEVDFNPFMLEGGTGAIIPNPSFIGASVVFQLPINAYGEEFPIVNGEWYIEIIPGFDPGNNDGGDSNIAPRSVRILSGGNEYLAFEHWIHGFCSEMSASGWYIPLEDVADELSIIPIREDFQIIIEGQVWGDPYYHFYKLIDGQWVMVMAVCIQGDSKQIFLTHGGFSEWEGWEEVDGESFLDFLEPGEYILYVTAWWGNSEAADAFQNFFRLVK